jgi:glycosyltransferase involved in cell wall biosynthesis
MNEPDIALLISTYQRPEHLRRALQSVALQEGIEGRIELVVTDDGSTDETPRIVDEFARSVSFPVGFTTHPHTTFQLSKCRNAGVRASRAPYLLFLDGDCVLPRDHVRIHLARRKPGVVMAGDCCRLERGPSEQVTLDVLRSGQFQSWAPQSELRRLKKLDRSSRFYRLIRHPTKPKLIGNNVGIWRTDFERVNGYDENFEGWGCEDDDLRWRLRRSGVQIESILRLTRTYHLWHETDVTVPMTWKQGANVQYLLRKGRLTRCRNGLEKRALWNLAIRIVGQPAEPGAVERLVRGRLDRSASEPPEIEILFLPGAGNFSGRAECNVLVALDPSAVGSPAARRAHLTITPCSGAKAASPSPIESDQFWQALGKVA